MGRIHTNLSITDGGAPIPPSMMPGSLSEALKKAAGKEGGMVFIEPEGTVSLSYADLKTEAELILKGLRAQGLNPGDPVIFQFERNKAFITAFWGCILGGFVPVPMALPQGHGEDKSDRLRIQNVFHLLEKPPVLTDTAHSRAMKNLVSRFPRQGLQVFTLEHIRQQTPDTGWYPAQGRDLALLMLTSGSTGTPKAVRLSHHNLLSRSAGSVQMNGFTSDDISLNWMPLDHVGGIIYFHLRDIFTGARQIHAATHLALEDPLRWLDWMDRYRVSVTWAPNFAFSLIVDQHDKISQGSWDLGAVRHIMNGGEAVVARTGRRFLSLLEAHGLPKGVMHPAFGMAEISSGITYSHTYDLETIFDDDPFVAVGRPIPGVSLRIVDDLGTIVPQGMVGNLQIRGETVMDGYHNDPEKTREAFDSDGWFRTGDLGFLQKGVLTITGRENNEIIVNGNNIYHHEIEAAVEALDGVDVTFTAACAVRTPSSNTDEIALFFCPDQALDDKATWHLIKEIRKTVIKKVGGARIHVVPAKRTDIPKTSLGKIQRPQLKIMFESGAFRAVTKKWEALEQERLEEEAKRAIPQSDAERQITRIWKTVLNLPRLGIHHNFFEMGGHSILLVQAHAQLKALFPGVTVTDVFKYPTASLLARHLTQKEKGPSSAQRARDRIARSRAAEARHSKSAEEDGVHGFYNTDVAVIGLSCRFPGARSAAAFWENLKNGVESITFFSREELIAAGVAPRTVDDPGYVKAAASLSDVDMFDANFFGFTPREAQEIDPQHRIFLETCWEALEDAGVDSSGYGGKIGLYAGSGMNTYLVNNQLPHRYQKRGEGAPVDINNMDGFQVMVAGDKDFLPTRIAYKLDLTGPCVNVQTACSTSLVAINMACQSLLSRQCDMALAGGISVRVPQDAGYHHQNGMIVSPDGRCRAFDAEAEGTIFGSGSGVVLLRPLADAIREKNHIYAVIKGTAVNNDGGMKVGYAAPSEDGQAAVVAEALEMAGVEAETISYLEAHGTGTLLGDPIEVAAMTQGLRTGTDKKAFCAIGSVKPNIGHLQIASGVAGFIKTVLMLHHKTLAPTINFSRPNPKIDFDNSPFFVNTRLAPWETRGNAKRRAGVNSVGIGGTNAHTILEEAPAGRRRSGPVYPGSDPRPWHLLVLSAQTDSALGALAERYAALADTRPAVSLPDLCYTAGTGRRPLTCRLAVPVRDTAQFKKALNGFLAGDESACIKGKASQTATLKTGFFFTGDGPSEQNPDEALYTGLPEFCRILDRIPPGDADLGDCKIFATKYAAARLLISWGIRPDLLSGRGTGLIIAACVAGVFSLEEGLRLAALRQRKMRILAQDGSMDSPAVRSAAGELTQAARSISCLPPRIPLASPGEETWTPKDLTTEGFWLKHLVPLATDSCRDEPSPSQAPDLWIGMDQNFSPGWAWLLQHLGRFFVRGGQVDWEVVYSGCEVGRISLPTYPWQRRRYWVDAPGVSPDDFRPDRPWVVPSPSDICRALAPAAKKAQEELAFYKELLPRLDQAATGYIVSALDRMGWDLRPGRTFETATLASRLDICRRHLHLWDKLIQILAQEGLLAARGNQWEVLPNPQPPAPCLTALRDAYPQAGAELDLFQRCGQGLDGVLQGKTDPLTLLFPGGDMTRAARIYRDTPSARRMNDLILQAVLQVIDRLHGDRLIRFLEIGAGTGSTTISLLPHLPPDRTEYGFTDISPLFTAKAEKTFSDYPFVLPGVLDIEKAPEPQGFCPGHYDIIIAANVLHATGDLNRTVDHVKSLLAPGGLLLLMEETVPRRWLDLTFGLTSGWWHFMGDPLRPGSPLAPAGTWESLLSTKGFSKVSTLSTQYQALMVAQTAASATEAAPEKEHRKPCAQDLGLTQAMSQNSSPTGTLIRQWQAAPSGEAAQDLVETYLKKTLSDAIRLPEHRMDRGDMLSRMGIDSLVAIELKNRLKTDLNLEIPASRFLSDASIRTLALEISRQLSGHLRGPFSEEQEKDSHSQRQPESGQPRTILMSEGQKALWFVHQTAPESPAYHVAIPLRINSKIIPEALEQSIQYLRDRHDLLRAVFPVSEGIPRQMIRPGGEKAAIEEIDAREWDDSLLKQQAMAANQRPFDLEQGPLFRAFWFRRSDSDHLLVFSFHHIIFDGHSLWLFLDELGHSYRAFSRERIPSLPPLEYGYQDFVNRQQAFLNGNRSDRTLAYWEKELSGVLPTLQLPYDHPRTPGQACQGATASFRLPPSLTEKLTVLARSEKTTLFSVLLSAYFILLYRYTGQEDILVGTPAAGRTDSRSEGILGYFINPVILRAAPKKDMRVTAFIRQVSQVVRDSIDHQEYPLPRLIQRLRPERGADHPPLFQTAFLLHTARQDRFETLFTDGGQTGNPLDLGGLLVTPFALAQQEGQFDLALEMIESGGTIYGNLKYDKALFSSNTAGQMTGHLKQLICGMAEDAGQTIAALPILTDQEKARLRAWNQTRMPFPGEKTVIDLFEARVAERQTAPALVCKNRQITYGELNRRANQMARFLTARGIKEGNLVGICLERSPEAFVAVLGILKAGCAYVPLDPDYPRNRLDFILKDADLSMVISRDRLAERLSVSGERLICMDRNRAELEGFPDTPLSRRYGSDSLAYVLYTSGTTGRPKGVMIGHQGLTNLSCCQKEVLAVTPESRVLQFASLSFDASCWEWAMALPHGAQLHIAPPEDLLPSAGLVRLLSERRITHVTLPPSALAVLPRADLPHLTCMVTAGEPCTAELVSKWSQGRSFINAYGPTESTVCATLGPCRDTGAPPDIGTPIANTQVHILDNALNPVPAGISGELCISGLGLAKGYLNRPDLTREKFVEATILGRTRRIYRTGDRARFNPDGTLQYLGRRDHQVKLRGFRIELSEIEAALCRHREVRQAVALHQGQEESARLTAYVTLETRLASAGEVRPPELKAWLQERLPGYMVPGVITVLDHLPLTPNGKIDRGVLAGRPAHGSASLDTSRTGLEQEIAVIWKEVLNLDAVGLRDNFFDLGGHSLLLARMQTRMESLAKRPLPITAFFQYPTIESLAAHLTGSGNGKTPDGSKNPSRSCGRKSCGSGCDIAVIGMSGRFPNAANTGEFWENLKNGRESITFFSRERLQKEGIAPGLLENPDYVRAAGYLEDVAMFDAPFFGYAPREAQILGPEQRIFLECAWEAIEDAGYDVDRLAGEVGVFSGCGTPQYLMENLVSNPALVDTMGQYQLATANNKDFLATRTSYKLCLKGPSINVQTACSSSLVAIHIACENLLAGQCDLALAGGVSITTPNPRGYLHEPGMITSADGHCRAFDARAGGTVPGSGAGIVVLKRLDLALADRDRVLAVIKGSAVNNDGAARVGYTSPGIDGQVSVISRALGDIDPESITYVEAHGTGTPLGDSVEIAALTQAFSRQTRKLNYCALGSVKTNIGHLDAAAGVAGLIKTILALHHRQIPASLHFEQPNPQIDFQSSPFFVNTALRPWPGDPSRPRRAGVSSFGIGGTNAHVIVQEPPRPVPRELPRRSRVLLPLSAATESALIDAADRLAGALDQPGPASPADLAFTLGLGRKAFDHRAFLVCRTLEEARSILGEKGIPRLIKARIEPEKQQVAFLFPGQGSQRVNMMQDLYREEPVFRDQVDHCCRALLPHLGFDLKTILYPDARSAKAAEQKLQETAVAQPALFVMEYALARLWISWGVTPWAMLGHSIGEYVAACLAGVFEPDRALALVAARGKLMQSRPRGAMLSIPLTREEVTPFLGETLCLAAHNAPSRCVVAGPGPEIEALKAKLAARKIESIRLKTSHAFHSQMMAPVMEEFSALVRQAEPRVPEIPFISNVTGTWITPDQAVSPGYWARHLGRTVEFSRGVETLSGKKACVFLEVGPGRTLSGLVRRHKGKHAPSAVIASQPLSGQEMDGTVLSALGRLWLAGVSVDWNRFLDGSGTRVSLPTYPFQRKRYWVEPGTPSGSALEDLPKRKPEMADWFYLPVWKESPARPADPSPADWLVFLDDHPVGHALVKNLEGAGHRVVRVKTGTEFQVSGDGGFTIRPGHSGDYTALMDLLENTSGIPENILHLWLVSTAAGTLPERLDRSQDLGFYSLLFLARALGLKKTTRQRFRIKVVTANVHPVTGEEALSPEKATAFSAVKLIPLEYDHILCRAIDIALPQSAADRRLMDGLLTEILSPDPKSVPMVALRGCRRWVPELTARRFEPVAKSGDLPLKRRGVYLITGGLGGMGLTMARHLAEAFEARLILTGRSKFPGPDDWDHWLEAHPDDSQISSKILQLREMEAKGGRVCVISADAADPDQMSAALQLGENRFGPVDGVIHAAGVVDHAGVMEKRISRKTTDPVLAPKVKGTLVLDDLFKGRNLDFMVLSSSAGSVLYPLKIGEVGYCGANEFMDSFCHYKAQHQRTYTVTINWDDWGEVGMSHEARNQSSSPSSTPGGTRKGTRLMESPLFSQFSTPALSPKDGWEIFTRVLAGRERFPRVIIFTRDLPQMVKACIQNVQDLKTAAPAHGRPDLATSFAAPGDDLERELCAIWETLLGIRGIGIRDDFFQLGGDSLLGTRLISRIREARQVELPVQQLFEGPTVALLAESIRALETNRTGPGLPEASPPEEETGTI